MLKNKLKKRISLLLAAVLVCSAFSVGVLSYGSDLVAINESNFTDAAFRRCVAYAFDTNDDGYLSSSELAVAKTIKVSGILEEIYGEGTNQQITSLKGIEFFTSCQRLRCGGVGLTELDVSALTNLIELTCPGNFLTELSLSSNTALEILNCSSNQLTSLDLSSNTALTRLDCYINDLTSINLSNNKALQILRCQQNELSSIDLSSNTALNTLNCSMNHLLALNLSKNTELTEITNANIGSQTVTATAIKTNQSIYVNLSIPDSYNITSTSLDRIETTEDGDNYIFGYVGYSFYPQSVDDIIDGIDYYYNTNLDGAEYMGVHVNVNRNFWQVKFFTDESKTELIESQIVMTGSSATLPDQPDAPQCKVFNGWSDSVANVREDREIYVKWKTNHTIHLTSFVDKVAKFDCSVCQSSAEEYNFAWMVNARQGSLRYASRMDMNSDGIINGKDFAMLLKAAKNNQ